MEIGQSIGGMSSLKMVIAIVVFLVAIYFVFSKLMSVPAYPRVDKGKYSDVEGFYGGVVQGSGTPVCLREIAEAGIISDKLRSGSVKYPADYRELVLLLGKIACFKKDIMSPSGIVQATLYVPYETAHDREPVAEVAGMCLQRTMSGRDLDIVFETWKERGLQLIRLLGDALKDSEVKELEDMFAAVVADVYEIAVGRCLAENGMTVQSMAESPRVPKGYLQNKDVEHAAEYDGYY